MVRCDIVGGCLMSLPPFLPRSTATRNPSRALGGSRRAVTTYAALAFALIALVVAVMAWIRPGSHSYSDQQSAQAKAKVCAAFWPVHKAVWEGTPDPRKGDPVAQLAVAANVRLAMLGGGSYLKETLAAEPATSSELAKAVTSLTDTLQRMGAIYLARMDTRPVIGPLLNDLNSQGAEVAKLCK